LEISFFICTFVTPNNSIPEQQHVVQEFGQDCIDGKGVGKV